MYCACFVRGERNALLFKQENFFRQVALGLA